MMIPGKLCVPDNRLQQHQGNSGQIGLFAGDLRQPTGALPLELRLRGKSTRQSMGTPIYYVDLTVRSGVSVEDALTDAKRLQADRQEAGFDQIALETAARLGFSNGAFEETDDEGIRWWMSFINECR